MSLGDQLRLIVSRWSVSWPIALGLGAVALAYLGSVHRARGWPWPRTIAFLAGLGCVLIATSSGVAADDDRLLSAHMVQHTILLLIAPLLLVCGRPAGLGLRALQGRRRRRLAGLLRRLTRATTPLVCLVVFAAVTIVTHIPWLHEQTLRHPLLHDGEHLAYLAAGTLFWWPLFGGDPVPAHRLGGLGRLVYVLAAMPPMALVGAYLTRHPTLVYPSYGPPARALGVSAVVDQAQAGAIMWVLGSLILTAAGLWAVMAALVGEERRMAAREARIAPGGGA